MYNPVSMWLGLWAAACNPNLIAGPAKSKQVCRPGCRVRVTPAGLNAELAFELMPFEGVYLGTFKTGEEQPGLVVQDDEGYKCHLWPDTVTVEVLA